MNEGSLEKYKIVVRVQEQEADLFRGAALLRTYPVSTGAKGLSCEAGSGGTPTGRLRVALKFGDGQPPGTVFRSRVATGELWTSDPSCSLFATREDLVLTRILWLEGCEPHNANTIERYIYFHGTNQEHLLGTPASHGCIRLGNDDVVDLYDRVPEGTEVEIIG